MDLGANQATLGENLRKWHLAGSCTKGNKAKAKTYRMFPERPTLEGWSLAHSIPGDIKNVGGELNRSFRTLVV